VSNHDLLGFYRTYRDRIQHVHLSNNAGKGWDSHLPVYAEGVLPVAEFLQEVTADGFAGSIALELDLRPWLDDEDGLHDVLVRNREFCESHLSAQSPAGEGAPAGR
jgi:sugar phosphate isomerase/epimerase